VNAAGARILTNRSERMTKSVVEAVIMPRTRDLGDGFAVRSATLRPGNDIAVAARGPARLLLFGGAPLDGPRHLWWNFVSSSRERIEQAKEDWKAGRFAPVPGETEFIPLPE
jgi:redox-sensitive bicupin YhaK (pirin superfamily)